MLKKGRDHMQKEKTSLTDTLSYVYSELNRVESIAGTLSTSESKHYKELTDIGDDRLNQIANEEQNASRQLGEVKQICISLAQKIEQIQQQYNDKSTQS